MAKYMLTVVLLFVLPASAAGLTEYYLYIEQDYLDELYADPYQDIEVPGFLTCSAGTSQCLVRFRGKSSLSFPKKSWAVNILDHSLLGRTRLNLNSEYMDPGMMRNCITLRATELLGFSASRTEHVRFFINNEYQGVFLDVERVDNDFFNRIGYTPAAVFKGFTEASRFMPLLSGESQLLTYRPSNDSETSVNLLQDFIDRCNCSNAPLPVDPDNLLAYYAVSLGLVDFDSGSNNYYLMMDTQGIWRVFPWDRSSSLGGKGTGIFYANAVDDTDLLYFITNTLYERLLTDPECSELLKENLEEVAELLSDEIPLLIDSVYNTIRQDLYDDPNSHWTAEDVDQAYQDLIWFCSERSQFLEDSCITPQRSGFVSFSMENPWLNTGESTQISVVIRDDSYTTVLLRWRDESTTNFSYLTSQPQQGDTVWTGSFTMPQNVSFCPFDVYFRKISDPRWTFFYPSHSLNNMHWYLRYAAPSAVVPAPGADTPQEENSFHVLHPQEYGPILWAVPVVNVSGNSIDLSCCVFTVEGSRHRIYIPPETLIGSQDTLYLTNSLVSFASQFPGKTGLGDFSCTIPENRELTLQDPAWQNLWSKPVPESVDAVSVSSSLIITEICRSQPESHQCEDWIEIYNNAQLSVNPGGWYLEDSQGNFSMIPEGTDIAPGEFLVLCREETLFRLFYPDAQSQTADLSFGLNGTEERLTLLDRCGNTVQQVPPNGYPDSGWSILSLKHPSLPLESSASWHSGEPPGTPGEANSLWESGGRNLSIQLLSGNPLQSGRIEYTLTTLSLPIEVFVCDLAGRIVIQGVTLESFSASNSLQLPDNCPAGVYFMVARTPEELCSRKLVVLQN